MSFGAQLAVQYQDQTNSPNTFFRDVPLSRLQPQQTLSMAQVSSNFLILFLFKLIKNGSLPTALARYLFRSRLFDHSFNVRDIDVTSLMLSPTSITAAHRRFIEFTLCERFQSL